MGTTGYVYEGNTVMTVGLPYRARERCLDIRVLLTTDEILTIEALRTLADRGTERLASRCVRPSPALLAALRRPQ